MKNNTKYASRIFHNYLFICLLTTGIFSFSTALAQETVIVGQVLNSADRSPIPSVSIVFKNTQIGVHSNEEGYFMIRTTGKETTLVFSSIGYKQQELKLKPGQSVGLEVTMEQQHNLLQEAFVIPGTNPALDLMKKVRWLKKANDVSRKSGYNVQSTEQNLVLLSKINRQGINKQLFDQLKNGNLSNADSSLVIPLYMAETKFKLSGTKKTQLSKNIFSSMETSEKIADQLVGEIDTRLNFYDNAVVVLGISLISPLSDIGNVYYNYYLTDSLHSKTGKQYEIHFRSINQKNLAFNGRLWIDSSTFSLVQIEAELPAKANLNFIHNLNISQKYEQIGNNHWTRQSEETTMNMTYELLGDSLHPKPEIFLKRSATFDFNDSISMKTENFAQSNYNEATLTEKMDQLNNTPALKKARWLADVLFTGYIPIGKIDVGKIQQFGRITDIEGLRLNFPFRTNEKLWKNISIGGYAGYGFKNREIKYSGIGHYKLPGHKRQIISINYTNDFRRIDYNYNDFMYNENPIFSDDVEIFNSIFTYKSIFEFISPENLNAKKLSERKEFSVSFSNDWNSDIESNVYIRSNQLIANTSLPMQIGNVSLPSLQQQSVTVLTRFSFGERTYEDHLQRIYIANKQPVIYGILEVGKYNLGDKNGNYSKLTGAIKQSIRLDIGELNYITEAGWLVGKTPYPLLDIPAGRETGGYSLYQFNMMDYMEYAADKYIHLHTELMMNGLILNQTPIIKWFNLREICSFKMAYGSLSDRHRTLLDYPSYLHPLTEPYTEVGVGVTNILHLFTVQSVWRLTNGIPWGIRASFSFHF